MISNLIARLARSKDARNAGWLVRGNVLAQLIQIAILPVLSRLYTPVEFGVLALFTSFLGIASVMLTLRFDSAILIARPALVAALTSIAVKSVMVVTIILVSLLALMVATDTLGFGNLPTWTLILMAAALLGTGLFNVGRAHTLRADRAETLAKSKIERSAAGAVVKIAGRLIPVDSAGLVIGETVAAWAAMRRVSSRLLWRCFLMQQTAGSRARAAWARFRKFPLIETPSSMLDQAAIMLPVPMVASIGGAGMAGAYAMARMIVVLPNAQVGRAIGDALQIKVARIVRDGRQSTLAGVILKTCASLLLLGVLPFGILIVFSESIFPWVLGDQWLDAGRFAAMLAVWMYIAFMVSPLSRVLSALQKQEFKLFYDLYVFGATCAAYWYASQTGMDSFAFVQLLVGLNVVGYVLYFAVIQLVVRSYVTGGKS